MLVAACTTSSPDSESVAIAKYVANQIFVLRDRDHGLDLVCRSLERVGKPPMRVFVDGRFCYSMPDAPVQPADAALETWMKENGVLAVVDGKGGVTVVFGDLVVASEVRPGLFRTGIWMGPCDEQVTDTCAKRLAHLVRLPDWRTYRTR